jgi:hypothetical protein
MQKPGASPQENADNRNSAEGAKFSRNGQTSLASNIVTSILVMSRLQRFLSEVTCPGAMPQAFAFRALGA